MYTSSLDTGTSIFLVLVIRLFSIFASSVRVFFETENRSSKTGMMLAICIDFSCLVDDSLGLLFLGSHEIFVSVGFLVISATDDIL